MERQISRIVIRLETGEDMTLTAEEFSFFAIKEGNLEIRTGGYDDYNSFIKTILAPGYWKKVDIFY
jgi:hypothetical protein